MKTKQTTESVKTLVLNLFATDKAKEWTVHQVIAALRTKHKSINENSIRFWITALKQEHKIKFLRNEGHAQVLKFGDDGMASLPQKSEKTSLKGAPVGISGDLAVIQNAKESIKALEALIIRTEAKLSRLRQILS